MINEKQIRRQLKKVIDPELGINIVDLGLIYGVKIEQKTGNVNVKMTLTFPGCPLATAFSDWVEEGIKEVKGVKKVKVDLVWEPVWTPERISKSAKKKLGVLG
ncbi:MAG: metal-sulfur cluster assembly factor [Candidatus Levyibacteriota bacterium]